MLLATCEQVTEAPSQAMLPPETKIQGKKKKQTDTLGSAMLLMAYLGNKP